MFTRKDYLDGKCSHHEYYIQIVHEIGINMKNDSWLDRCKKEYLSGDVHLNNIALQDWDRRAMHLDGVEVRRAFKKHLDFLSLAGQVCVLKTAMIHSIMETGND